MRAIALILTALLLAACQGQALSPTWTPKPTRTPTPAATDVENVAPTSTSDLQRQVTCTGIKAANDRSIVALQGLRENAKTAHEDRAMVDDILGAYRSAVTHFRGIETPSGQEELGGLLVDYSNVLEAQADLYERIAIGRDESAWPAFNRELVEASRLVDAIAPHVAAFCSPA